MAEDCYVLVLTILVGYLQVFPRKQAKYYEYHELSFTFLLIILFFYFENIILHLLS